MIINIMIKIVQIMIQNIVNKIIIKMNQIEQRKEDRVQQVQKQYNKQMDDKKVIEEKFRTKREDEIKSSNQDYIQVKKQERDENTNIQIQNNAYNHNGHKFKPEKGQNQSEGVSNQMQEKHGKQSKYPQVNNQIHQAQIHQIKHISKIHSVEQDKEGDAEDTNGKIKNGQRNSIKRYYSLQSEGLEKGERVQIKIQQKNKNKLQKRHHTEESNDFGCNIDEVKLQTKSNSNWAKTQRIQKNIPNQKINNNIFKRKKNSAQQIKQHNFMDLKSNDKKEIIQEKQIISKNSVKSQKLSADKKDLRDVNFSPQYVSVSNLRKIKEERGVLKSQHDQASINPKQELKKSKVMEPQNVQIKVNDDEKIKENALESELLSVANPIADQKKEVISELQKALVEVHQEGKQNQNNQVINQTIQLNQHKQAILDEVHNQLQLKNQALRQQHIPTNLNLNQASVEKEQKELQAADERKQLNEEHLRQQHVLDTDLKPKVSQGPIKSQKAQKSIDQKQELKAEEILELQKAQRVINDKVIEHQKKSQFSLELKEGKVYEIQRAQKQQDPKLQAQQKEAINPQKISVLDNSQAQKRVKIAKQSEIDVNIRMIRIEQMLSGYGIQNMGNEFQSRIIQNPIQFSNKYSEFREQDNCKSIDFDRSVQTQKLKKQKFQDYNSHENIGDEQEQENDVKNNKYGYIQRSCNVTPIPMRKLNTDTYEEHENTPQQDSHQNMVHFEEYDVNSAQTAKESLKNNQTRQRSDSRKREPKSRNNVKIYIDRKQPSKQAKAQILNKKEQQLGVQNQEQNKQYLLQRIKSLQQRIKELKQDKNLLEHTEQITETQNKANLKTNLYNNQVYTAINNLHKSQNEQTKPGVSILVRKSKLKMHPKITHQPHYMMDSNLINLTVCEESKHDIETQIIKDQIDELSLKIDHLEQNQYEMEEKKTVVVNKTNINHDKVSNDSALKPYCGKIYKRSQIGRVSIGTYQDVINNSRGFSFRIKKMDNTAEKFNINSSTILDREESIKFNRDNFHKTHFQIKPVGCIRSSTKFITHAEMLGSARKNSKYFGKSEVKEDGKDQWILPYYNRSRQNTETSKKRDSLSNQMPTQNFLPPINQPLSQQGQKISHIDFLKLPKCPNADTSQSQLVALIKSLCLQFGQETGFDSAPLSIKKYRNCIVAKLTEQTGIIWNFEGRFYYGGYKADEKHGLGIEQQQQTGKDVVYIYKGQFRKGKKHGKGILRLVHNQQQLVYQGQWEQGQKHGIGIQIENYYSYTGEWVKGKKEGKGKIVRLKKEEGKAQQYFQGYFHKNMKHGDGYERFKNGDTYEGTYVNNKIEGKGVYTWNNKSVYKGEFKDGMRWGQGIWKSAVALGSINSTECDSYKGEYRADKKDGVGVYTWKSGVVYEGQFRNDLRNGKGQLIFPDGRSAMYIWNDGVAADKITTNLQNKTLNNPEQRL